MNIGRRILPALLGGVAAPALASQASAQTGSWPDRPIRLVAPYPPGGQTDVVARWLADQLRTTLPQPIVVENRAGAQGIIGTQAVLAAPADGYSVLYVNASTTLINPVIHPGPPYDTFRDMAPVVQFGTAALVLTLRPDRGINTLAELLAEARRRPGEISYASFGIGSASHLYGAMLEKAANVRMSHVPYRGSAAAVQDVLAGHAFISINDEAVSIPQIQGGRLKALAVTGTQRIAPLPDVPTFGELGFGRGLEILGFNGLAMRAGTPLPIIRRFADLVLEVVRSPTGRERLATMGLLATGLGPEEFASQLRRDAPIWAQAARDSGARVE